MGVSKKEIFTDRVNRLATLAKALGHPARIAIIEVLIQENSCICRDLVSEIGLSQPTISQHLKELKDVGLIKGTVDGPKMCYCLDISTIHEIRDAFSKLTTSALKSISDCC